MADAKQPHPIDLVQELRREVGLFDGAMPITPKQAWEEALGEVKRLRLANALVWLRTIGWDWSRVAAAASMLQGDAREDLILLAEAMEELEAAHGRR